MSRYIDANELLKRLPDDLPYKASVKRVLIQAPSADVEEVRHGYWVSQEEATRLDRFDLAYACSVCGHCDWDCTESENFNYCPNCGAKMDGGREENEG